MLGLKANSPNGGLQTLGWYSITSPLVSSCTVSVYYANEYRTMGTSSSAAA